MIEKREWLAIGCITALALACRLAALGQPMRFDESVSWAYYVGRSWSTIVGTYHQPNNHVFYSLLAKLAGSPASYAPWALRLPALVAGVAIVPLTWAVGRRYSDAATALLAAALAAGSTQLVLYSTNARGYTLYVVCFLGLLLIADRLRARETRGLWIGFAALGAIGLYTIPIMLYPLGVAAVWLALPRRGEPAERCIKRTVMIAAACAMAGLVAGALYLPIIRSAGLSALAGNKFVAASSWPTFVQSLPRMVASTLVSWTSPLPEVAAMLLVVIAVVGILNRARHEAPSLAVAAALWCTLLLVLTHRAPFVRVWLFLLPPFLLAVARGCCVLLERVAGESPVSRWREGVSVGLAALMVVTVMVKRSAERSDDTGAFRSAEQVTAILAPRLQHGDRVLAPIPSIGPLLYYFPRAGADTALLTVPTETARRAFLVLSVRDGQTLDWAVRSHMVDPREFTTPVLLGRFEEGGAELWETTRR